MIADRIQVAFTSTHMYSSTAIKTRLFDLFTTVQQVYCLGTNAYSQYMYQCMTRPCNRLKVAINE